MPLRPCAKPGCSELVPSGERWCPPHKTQHLRDEQDQRGSAASRGYGHRWQRARANYLAGHPLCVLCQGGVPLPGGLPPSRVTPATVVDHVVDHKGDPALFWDASNWRALCAPHHNARVDAGDFGRQR